MAMEAAEFADRLGRLSRHDIDEIAGALRTVLGSAEGEVAWWKATIAVDRTLRHRGQSRVAGRAAWAAAHAVLESAEREGMLPEEKDDVTAVARAASDVARGLIAGGSVSILLADLVRVWRPVFVPAVA
jgi:hypothetical protein